MREEIFAELTYHAAYDPQRAIRTRRHKYIRLFGDRLEPVLPEHRRRADQGPARRGRARHAARARASASTTSCSTPWRRTTWSGDPEYADVLADLRARLEAWMEATDDPLLAGPVPAPEGAEINDPAAARRPSRRARARGALSRRALALASRPARGQ